MLKRLFKKSGSVSTKTLLLIFLSVALLVISSAVIELAQSKDEMYELMSEQSHSLLETMLAASRNALTSSDRIEEEIKSRLLNNANLIRILFEENRISNKKLSALAEQNKIYRINIFDRSGKKLFSSQNEIHTGLQEQRNPIETLQPIFNGKTDSLFVGIKKARFEEGSRFIVAVASKNRDAIVLNVDAEQLLDFRKEIGFGQILIEASRNPGISYVALQDFEGIIAGAGKVELIDPLEESEEIETALQDSTFGWRIADYDSLQVFEAFHPFVYEGGLVGIFRVGLSLEPIENINARILRRALIIGLILILLGSIILMLIVSRQNLNLLSRQYDAVESYSNEIVQNVTDAIIVLDHRSKVRVFNKRAEELFGRSSPKFIGLPIDNLDLPGEVISAIKDVNRAEVIETNINEKKHFLLISKSKFVDEAGNINTILLIRDMTELKKLEVQVEMKDRLSAMGQLASGVAHEIRNPLNTIATIIQQLEKDFEPVKYKDDYYSLASVVRKEVKRINETIESFLRFSKPEPIMPAEFRLSELIDQIEEQYRSMLGGKSVKLLISNNYKGSVYWDKNKIKQVLMNLIQNAYDAFENNGTIKLGVSERDLSVVLKISDNGPGIPKQLQSKIFNLYFTTKAKGTGIGLSIVQRIVDEHGGEITLESEEGSGSVFTLIIPVDYLRKSN